MEIKKWKITPNGSVNVEKVMEWIKDHMKNTPQIIKNK